jgi:hypothetical protein
MIKANYKTTEHHRAKQRDYYKNNRKKCLDYTHAYQKQEWFKALRRAKYTLNRKEARNKKLIKKFGITSFEYDELLKIQKGVCAICGSDKAGGRWKRFPVDHDHTTGRVRGLLCTRCNRCLGLFKDDINILKAALTYLESK